ncbi:MAG TPA: methyltransferase domain-containing protein [Thermoanaerobaculia bacterium]|nr:methyltransferase domain-containing protein [Thermoanaerobaculia bacterium]
MKKSTSDPSAPEAQVQTETVGEFWSRKLQGPDFTSERFWGHVPEVERRVLQRASAVGPVESWAEACVREFLAGRTPVERMLSVGCGTGELERTLARLNAFRECDAWDIAPGGIEIARRLAREEGFHQIHYEVRDVTAADMPPERYDAVWFESALHHIEPLERVCEQVARTLKADGFLFLNEYVGPSAFAFSPRQKELIRAAFALIPARFRRSFQPGGPEYLSAAPIPTPAEVQAEDPTESVRSADILAVLPDYFDIVSRRETGGTLLQFLLHGIAGNFHAGDPDSLRVLRMLFEIEDALLETGEVRSDFVVIAARPRRPVVAKPPRPHAPPPQEPALASSLEDDLAEKRMYLIQAEQYARSLEAEVARQQAQLQEIQPYVHKLEDELARKQAHAGEVETYAKDLEAGMRQTETHLHKTEAHLRHTETHLRHTETHLRHIEAHLHQTRAHLETTETHLREAEHRAAALQQELDSRRRCRIHAVTVHHRGKDLLDHSLRSLLDTRGAEIDVVVVSNACQEPLPELIGQHPRIHLVHLETSAGFSEANNRGVAWALEHLGEPDHWFFVNNDAAVEPDTLRRLAEALEAAPHGGIAGPLLRIWGAEDHLNSLGLNVTAAGEAWDEGIGLPLADYGPLPGRREVLAVTGSALLIRAATLREIGGWSELYGYYMEDIDLCLKARSRGWTVVHAPDAVASHAISATADQISDFKRFHSWRNQFVLLLVHWPLSALLRVLPRIVASQLAIHRKRMEHQCYDDARLQRKVWTGALRLLPAALRQRRKSRGDRSWTRFLLKPGTVPEIRLPKIPPGRRPWERSST